MLKTLLSHRTTLILSVITLYLCVASFLPPYSHQLFYTISLLIKDLLLWMLPVTVCCFIAHAICSFEKKAPLFILTLLLFEACSNALSIWYAYGWGHLVIPSLESFPSHPEENFFPLFRLFARPEGWSASRGTLTGLVLGLIATFRLSPLKKMISFTKEKTEWILTRIFARLIPLFVLGFIAKMYQTHLLQQMQRYSLSLLVWLVVALLLYLLLLFLLGSGHLFLKSIKNLLPAGAVAFTSGCSLSTMPWTIAATAKNLQNPHFAHAVIPASTNIQQIGDCIINAFLCFAIYTHFNGYPPDLSTWASFTLPFVLARFATAAVMGGAIFVMLPIYETYLKFTPEMIALILAFNVILDPLVTGSNVMANGASCRLFERLWLKLNVVRSNN